MSEQNIETNATSETTTPGEANNESATPLSTEALDKLYRDEVLPIIGRGLCVTIHTQITDVEDEINGLVTYDRKVTKVRKETMCRISQALQKEME